MPDVQQGFFSTEQSEGAPAHPHPGAALQVRVGAGGGQGLWQVLQPTFSSDQPSVQTQWPAPVRMPRVWQEVRHKTQHENSPEEPPQFGLQTINVTHLIRLINSYDYVKNKGFLVIWMGLASTREKTEVPKLLGLGFLRFHDDIFWFLTFL